MNRGLKKMRIWPALGFILLLLGAGLSFAESDLTVNLSLKDGTQIKGKLLSLENGVFEVKTTSMGVVNVPESEVVAMQSNSSLDVSANKKLDSEKLQSLQNSMMKDPVAMEKIMALQQNPEFMKVLQDPAVMKAIQSGDYDALSNNPVFKDLMENSAIKELVKEYK